MSQFVKLKARLVGSSGVKASTNQRTNSPFSVKLHGGTERGERLRIDMGFKRIFDLPVLEQNRFGFCRSLLHLKWLISRDRVEELLYSADMFLGAELLVQLHCELFLGVLLRWPRTHKIAKRLDRLRDKRQRSVCLYVLQTRRNKNWNHKLCKRNFQSRQEETANFRPRILFRSEMNIWEWNKQKRRVEYS